MATMKTDIFIFGGYSGEGVDIVAKYNGETWTQVQSLLTPRYGQRSIVQNNIIFHIGGHSTRY